MVDYTPGVCNIDLVGQKKRMIFGISGVALGSIIFISLIIIKTISMWWIIVAFIFLWIGMLGIVQSKAKFCVANAAKAQYEVKGKMTSIEDKQSQLLDKKRARVLHIQAIGYAILLTVFFTIILLVTI